MGNAMRLLIFFVPLIALLSTNCGASELHKVEAMKIEKINKPHLQLIMEYPYIEIAPLFNKLVRKKALEGWLPRGETLQGILDSKAEEPKRCVDFCNTVSLKYSISYQDDKLISVEFDGYFFFEGSLHGSPFTTTINYDFDQGREVQLSDLYDLADLAAICNEKLKDVDCLQRKVLPAEQDFNNWALGKDGLKISWDVYHLGSYACGPQSVTIPHAELKKTSK